MQIHVNGEAQSAPAGLVLPQLVERLRLGERRVAVELNGEIVPRSRWGDVALRDGDRIEIVQAIGGG